MPVRNYYRKKRVYRRRARVNKTKKMVTGQGPTMVEKMANGLGSVATLARAVAPVISMINTELKYTDTNTSLTAYNPGTNDAIQLLSAISQGDDDVNRIGNSVLAKNITLKAQMQYTADSTQLIVLYRLILFVWKANANSNPPTVAKLFEAPTNILSAMNKDYTDQLVVIKDTVCTEDIGFVPTTTNAAGICYRKVYKKLDFHIRWLNATTGITENHVYVCFRCSSPLINNAGTCNLYSRINYTDN